MQVYALSKIHEHPDTKGSGAQKGDISTFKPLNYEFSKEELRFFLPVVVDLIIPCRNAFMNPKHKDFVKCGSCPNYDNDLCDNAKYCRAVWSAGNVLNPPKIIRKRKYNINRDILGLTAGQEALIVKADKTVAEIEQVISDSKTNVQLKEVITDNG